MVKVEVLVLLAAISIVAAVPTKSSKASRKLSDVQKKFVTDHMKYQSMLDKRDPKLADDYEKMKAINAATEAEKIDQLNVRSFRLPNNTIPLLYDIHIRTNVHSADFAFHGLTRINIRVLETSNTITMHSSRMLIQQINLLDAQGNMLERELPFTFDSVLEFITITTFPILEVDEELIVEIEYSGFLSNDGWGFYRTRYIDQELGTFWVATTLFEPTFARRAFPCFDEIRYRVPFDIRIVHHESYHALSNMPVATTARNGDFITTTFDTTPAMPTHNVAFTVSNFASISNNESDHRLMSVYAVPAAVAAGRADSALELGVTFLNVLEELFEIPFALPKSDQVAVDNWRNGEGWGLIKIDDWILLRNVVNDFRLRTRRISIAHEYSVG